MSSYIDQKETLIAALPASLSRDEDKKKLAETIAEELIKAVARTDCAAVFPRIDELPEEVLDVLAYDLKIEWYEPEAPIWNKRLAVKECILVHKYKGTKYAVETALHSIYKSAEVLEWFEYGGEPFHFQINVYGSSGSELNKLYLKVQYAKNLRSTMDNIHFVLIPDKEFEEVCGLKIVGLMKRVNSGLEYLDDSIFTSRGMLYGAASSASFSKRLNSGLENYDDSIFTSRGTLFGGYCSDAFEKRIKTTLTYKGNDEPQRTRGNITAGCISSCFVKIIRTEVKL